MFFAWIYFILGLIIGSFINAAVYRVRKKKDLVFARSICPNCKHVLAPLDLIPLFSWLILLAKCRYCRKKISIQYPLVELAVGLLYLANYMSYLRFPDLKFSLLGYAGLIVLPLMVFIFVYDLKYKLILNRSLVILYATGALYLLAQLFTGLDPVLPEILISVGGAFSFFYALFYLGKGRWMGGGDVKLVPAFGLFFGYLTLQAIFLAFVSGSVVSLALLAIKTKNMKSTIPFGPFLVFGFILTFFFMNRIWSGFLNYFDHLLFGFFNQM